MAPYYVYVTLSGEDKIAVYAMDRRSGRLDLLDAAAVPGRPAPLALHPNRRFLYVGRRDDREVSTFEVDGASGRLSHVGAVPLESDPCYLATDRRGRYLLSAYYADGKVGAHRIGDDGALDAEPVEWRATGPGAHSIQADPSNQFVFVPHIATLSNVSSVGLAQAASGRTLEGGGADGPNAIFQFRFEQDTGRLTPGSPAQVSPGRKSGPRHFCFHPTLDVLYFSDEQGNSVTAYSLDRDGGTLEPVQTVSTLPEDAAVFNTCAQIQISPTGRMLYAPNRGHDTIACFAVDAAGRIERVANVPTEPIPRAFSLDPSGSFLLAAGLESGKLAEYRADEAAGSLHPVETYAVGSEPMWVLIADLQ